MDFKLSNGPWKQMFNGVFEGYEVEIVSNPDSVLLVSILEKEGETVNGAILQLYKVFSATGELESFVETLPRDVLAVTKHNKKETIRFLLMGSKPSYTKYEENAYDNEVKELINQIKTSTKMVLDVSKAYDIELTELNNSPEKVKEAFFSQPLIVPLLAASTHSTGEASVQGKTNAISFGEIILGITRAGMLVKEPLSLFQSTIVSGKGKDDRTHALHILLESALLSNLPAVAIDWDNAFEGMSKKAEDTAKLQKYKVNVDPIGFPLKEFYIPEQLKVDLNIVDKEGLVELFGVEESVAGKAIIKAIEENKVGSLSEVAKILKTRKPEGEFNEFQRGRSVRIVKLMELEYPELFGGKNNIKDLSKGWLRGIGRAGIIKMEKHDARTSLLMVHTIVRGLLEYYKKQGPSKQLRSLFVLPSAEKVLSRNQSNKIVSRIVENLKEMHKYGVGFAVGSEREKSLTAGIEESSTAQITIIKGNDVGVQLKGRKNYRVQLRPGISQSAQA